MNPGRVEAGFDLGTDPTNLMPKNSQYWKSDTEFGPKARTELGPTSETLGPDSTDKCRETWNLRSIQPLYQSSTNRDPTEVSELCSLKRNAFN